MNQLELPPQDEQRTHWSQWFFSLYSILKGVAYNIAEKIQTIEDLIQSAIFGGWSNATVTSSHANATVICKRKRVGNDVFYRMYILYSGTASGAMVLTIPDTIDSSKLPNSITGPILGTVLLEDASGGSGSGRMIGLMRYESDTSIKAYILVPVSGTGINDLRTMTGNDPTTIASGDAIYLDLKDIPVVS